MRKWLLVGVAMLTLGSATMYWHFNRPTWEVIDSPPVTPPVRSNGNNDGNAEQSDVIEPLIVDDRPGAYTANITIQPEVASRAILATGISQPPRPDAENGAELRMPYAEEDEGLAEVPDPILQIVNAVRAAFNLMDDPQTQELDPNQPPMADPHHNHPPHCPYMGGCPFPNRFR